MTAPKNLWIRVDADAPMDPKFAALSEDLGVSETFHSFGMCVAVWCAMAFHVPDGDLSGIPDAALERWAGWHGERGRFAASFRALFTQDDVCQAFASRQGAIHRTRDKARERLKKFRERNANRNVSETAVLRPTERNGTEHITTSPDGAKKRRDRAPKPDSAPSRITWLTPLCEAHEAVMGAGSFAAWAGQYAKAFRGLVDAQGADRCAEAIRRALSGPEARFLTPAKIAARFAEFSGDADTRLVDVSGDWPAPEAA